MDDNQSIESSVKSFGGKIQDKATQLGDNAATTVRDNVNRATETLKSAAGTASDEMRGAAGNLTETVKEQPLLSLLVVGGLGLILGFLLRR